MNTIIKFQLILALGITGLVYSKDVKIHKNDLPNFWILLKHSRSHGGWSTNQNDKIEIESPKIWGIGKVDSVTKAMVSYKSIEYKTYWERFAEGEYVYRNIFKIPKYDSYHIQAENVLIKNPTDTRWMALLVSVGFERADAFLSVWNKMGDSLKLVGISENSFALGIQGIGFGDYGFTQMGKGYSGASNHKAIIILKRSGGDAGSIGQNFDIIIWWSKLENIFSFRHHYEVDVDHIVYDMALKKDSDQKYVPLLISTKYEVENYKRSEISRDTVEINISQ